MHTFRSSGPCIAFVWLFACTEAPGQAPDASAASPAEVASLAETTPAAEVESTIEPAPIPAAVAAAAWTLRVLDLAGQPIPGASVTTSGNAGVTDAHGFVELRNLVPGRRVARAHANGYGDGSSVADLAAGVAAVGVVRLQATLAPAALDAHSGGTVKRGPVTVQLPPDALRFASGAAVVGSVAVHITPWNPWGPQLAAAPGPLVGTDGDTPAVPLQSLFMADVTLRQGDHELQLAPGKSASLSFDLPAAATVAVHAGQVVPAWWYDFDGGMWRRDGSGTVLLGPDGLRWQAQVGHFTPWNVDTFSVPGCGCIEVVQDGKPAAGAGVHMQSLLWGFAAAGVTDAKGRACFKPLTPGTLLVGAWSATAFGPQTPLFVTTASGPTCDDGPKSLWPHATVTLEAPGCLRVTVKDQGGLPVAAAKVAATFAAAGGAWSDRKVTAATGTADLKVPRGAVVDIFIAAVSGGMAQTAKTQVTAPEDGSCGVPVAVVLGQASACPVAVVAVKPGTSVIPQTELKLVGSGSFAPTGTGIAQYQWTAKQPAGSFQSFVPSAKFANVGFTANVGGTYEFCLQVTDGNGKVSCEPACHTVEVVPLGALHASLLWDTPGDPDQTDTGPQAGADLDLHVAIAAEKGPDLDCDGLPDPWFQSQSDLFWFNPAPNWTTGDSALLDLDDTDGAGPENVNAFTFPSATGAYTIAAHVWHSWGFGPSTATVRIWSAGTLMAEFAQPNLTDGMLWVVGRVHAKGATVVGSVVPCQATPGETCGGALWWQPGAGAPCVHGCYPSTFGDAIGLNPGKCKTP